MKHESGEPRVLFCSYHSYLDHSSGAALATRDLLELLAQHHWKCAVLSGPDLDDPNSSLEDALRMEKTPFQYRPGSARDVPCTLYHAALNDVLFHGFVPAKSDRNSSPSEAEANAFLNLLDSILKRFQPDILITFGGKQVTRQIVQRAKQTGAKIVFALHNLDYIDRTAFEGVDSVFVPSVAAQKHYQQKLGLASTVIAGPWNRARFWCPEIRGRFVTFVNPQPYKGAFWVARIAHHMGRRRPDIPFLIVEGRGKAEWLAQSGLDFSQHTNLRKMPNTADPRRFYRISHIVLVPSLCQEAHPRVAVESIINGIPVLASRRGGLPEILTDAGYLLDIPEKYTPQSLETPTVEEVEPWVRAIEDLWDIEMQWSHERKRCQAASAAWSSDRVYLQYKAFFSSLTGQ